MMQEQRPFTAKSYSAGAQYDSEYTGRPLRGVGFSFDATASTGPTAETDDSTYRLLKSPRLIQNEANLIDMEAADLRHLSAFLSRGYDPFTGGTSSGSRFATATIDFSRLAANAVIDVTDSKLFIRGEFGAASELGTGSPAISGGDFRPFALTTGRQAPARHLRPKFYQRTVDLGQAGSDVQARIAFDQQVALAGFMVRFLDGTDRVDGLCKSLSLDVANGNDGAQERYRATMGQARATTCHFGGYGDADRTASQGVIFIPTLNPDTGGGLMAMGQNDSCTFHFDTSSTVEDEYTNVTPGGNETAVITVLAFSAANNPRATLPAPASEVRTANNVSSLGQRARRPGR